MEMKIISISDDNISLGGEDGKVISASPNDFDFDPKLDQRVEAFKKDDNTFIFRPIRETPSEDVIIVQNSSKVIPTGNVGNKSKVAAGLLGIFLGSLGVHNFYLGFITKGIIQLLLTLLTFGIGLIASEIWALVEGILILTSHTGDKAHQDAQGNELRD